MPPASLFALLACAAAWHPGAPKRFDVVVPDGWSITRNRTWLGNDTLALAQPDVRATITIELVHADARSRVVPLDLLAEARALSTGRALGVESDRTHMHQLALDGHEAWAVTGRRRWHFAAADYTAVYTRVGGHVAVISLVAPAGKLDTAAGAWTVVLETLRFPRDEVPEDAPIFDPTE